MNILVVDDEEDLCEILQFNLELEGYTIHVAHSAEEALNLPLAHYDLILLDVMMGQISGFRMAQIMRADPALRHIPIIFITARDTENDLVTGFNLGADDYIQKPFSIREVILRVKAVLRRTITTPPDHDHTITFEGLTLNLDNKQVTVDGTDIPFTKKEFELLRLFLENPDRVYSREQILHTVWSDEVVVLDRTVDVNITRIRKKIGPYSTHLTARQGYGYVFNR